VDYYICVCYHQNLTLHKDGVNNFPLFDDDKPNGHIDIRGENKLKTNEASLEEGPGIGVKGVLGPCSEAAVSPFAILKPQLIRVLLPISSVICTPNLLLQRYLEVLKN